MKPKSFIGCLALSALIGLAAGCRKRGSGGEIAVSPIPNPPPSLVNVPNAGPPPGPGVGPGTPPGARLAAPSAAGSDDWRKEKPHPRRERRAAPPVARPAASPAVSDTSAADEKRRRDEDARQQAIDRALAKLKVRFGGCFDLGPPGRGAAVLRFKLHRTGFVLAPSVSGVDSKVASCIGSALARLRVEGPQGETITVQRRIQFHTVQR